MERIKLSQRLRYYFENTLSTGPASLIKWLGIISLLVIIICGLLILSFGIPSSPEGEPLGFFEGIWQSLMATLDSGTMGGDEGWPFRTIRLLATLAGIFIISVLIGAIGSTIDSAIEELKKGRSHVLVKNHTLILGWSEKIFGIIKELAEANSNMKRPKVVIMADRDKVEMDDEIRSKCGDTKNTQIIVRSGNPLEPTDILILNPNEARSIIVLGAEEGNSDTHVIKSVLALTNGKHRKIGKYNIVAEIKNPKNMEAAELVGGDEAVFVLSRDLISRVTAQTCRQSGLSIVYSDLLQFEGDEIYFQHESKLAGKTYKDALFGYTKSSVMGIYDRHGRVHINPPMDRVISDDDKIIAISNDDDTIILENKSDYHINKSAISRSGQRGIKREHTLILGWNDRGQRIIEELDNYVAEGSEVYILADAPALADDVTRLQGSLKKQQVSFRLGNINDKATLESLQVERYDYIIILSYTDNIDVQESDAKTLITLLHLRNISERLDKDFSIVSEMRDMRNRELAEVAKADDFIVSDNLVSLMVSQLSENRELKKVYDILFRAEGSEIYLKPAINYVKPGMTVNFYTVLESAAQQGETAIGYRLYKESHNSQAHYGIHLNPNKNVSVTFEHEDKIIVIAEN